MPYYIRITKDTVVITISKEFHKLVYYKNISNLEGKSGLRFSNVIFKFKTMLRFFLKVSAFL